MTDFGKILAGINQKDEKAWKVLFNSFYGPLCHHAWQILRDDQIAADVVQETFIRLWNSDICFKNDKGMVTYLYRSISNNSMKYQRDREIETRQLKEWYEQEEMSKEEFSSVVREEVARKLRELLNRLPKNRREIVLMSLKGLSGEEIATQLGISIHTVKQQKYRAYKFIRAHLSDDLYIMIFFLYFLKNI